MKVTEFEEWLAQAVESGSATRKEIGETGYKVMFENADVYHTVYVERAEDGQTEITVGCNNDPYIFMSESI